MKYGFLRLLLVVATTLLLCSCATNKTSFTETTASGDTTTFTTKVQATVGSKLQEGAGSMSYKGVDWQLDVGSAAEGLQAGGDIAEIIQSLGSLVELMKTMAPLFMPLPDLPDSATPNPLMSQIVSAIDAAVQRALANRAPVVVEVPVP